VSNVCIHQQSTWRGLFAVTLYIKEANRIEYMLQCYRAERRFQAIPGVKKEANRRRFQAIPGVKKEANRIEYMLQAGKTISSNPMGYGHYVIE